jgi:outer membrane lipoprotein-sorting protein
MVRSLHLFCLLLLVLQGGCFWKNDTPIEERIFDVYGTVQSISLSELVIQDKNEEITFRIVPSSIKGSSFEPGAYVHVYYKSKGDVKEVTMVVEKIE